MELTAHAAALAAAVRVESRSPSAAAALADAADTDTTAAAGLDAGLCHLPPWRPMPLDVLPPVLRAFVADTARVMDVDPSQVALPVLAVVSSAVGNTRRLVLKDDYRVPAVLWPVVVAESGDGKSPAFRAALRPLVDEQNRHAAAHAAAIAEHAKARRAWQSSPRDTRGDEPPPPGPMPDVFVSDATVEALAAVLADNPRGVLCGVDEFAGVVKSFNAYKSGGADLEAYLSLYDAGYIKVNRKTGERRVLFVPSAFVALTGTIQPAVLRRVLLADDMVNCGFAARLLLAMPPRRVRGWSDDDVPMAVRHNYAGLIAKLRAWPLAGEPEPVYPTAAAARLWAEWWDDTEAARVNADAATRAVLPKVRDAAARIALLFHCCRVATGTAGVVADRLDDASMSDGVMLARWFADEANRVYATLAGRGGTTARRRPALREWIAGLPDQSATARDVMRGPLAGDYPNDAKAVARALHELVEAGEGTWQHPKPGRSGGRPTAVFVLNTRPPADTTAGREAAA